MDSSSATLRTVPSVKNWTGEEGEFRFGPATRVVVNLIHAQLLAGDAQTFAAELKALTGQSVTVVNGGEPSDGDFFLTLREPDFGIGVEGYVLTVGDHVQIGASTTDGVFRGTRSVLQALAACGKGPFVLPRGICRDWPDYPLRGLMIDVARRYLSMSFLEGWIRRLSWYRMNVLHIHFTDAEGFRLQCDMYPGLSADLHYTKTDIRTLEALAAKYHVTIIPEIDMPGHASPIIGYDKSLAFKCPNLEGTIDVTSPHARNWLRNLLEEYLPLFAGPYFHIGTDEFPVPYHWNWTEDVLSGCAELTAYQQSKGYSEPMDCFVEFMNWANSIIRSHGKTMRMWQWWDWAPNGIHPDPSIEIDLWEPAKGRDPSWFAEKGYRLLNSSEGWLYYTPGIPAIPTVREYYEGGAVTDFHTGKIPRESCTGLKTQLWGDKDYNGLSEMEINSNLVPWQAALAEVAWGGPRSTTLDEFYARQKAVGEPSEELNAI